METIFARCAGLDIHKETVEATVRILEGIRVRQQSRGWGTMTGEVQAMADWLEGQGVHTWPWNRPGYSGNRSTTSWKVASR